MTAMTHMRYLVFGGGEYGAAGGFKDFLSDFDDKAFAINYARQMFGAEIVKGDATERIDWVQVADLDMTEIVFELGDACPQRAPEGTNGASTRENGA